MPSLSLNIGLNNGRKLPFGGGAAPSQIPTATTISVNIIVPSFGLDGFFAKLSPDYWQGPEDYLLVFVGDEWHITYTGEDISYNFSASQTVNYIPQTSWNVTTTITVVS
jgi:hypothetical protein